MNLSPHFTEEELTITQVRGIDNTPPAGPLLHLQDAANGMEQVRSLLGNRPITVNSGYRSPIVNRIVGGSPTSAHMDGYAIDFICPAFGTPEDICRAIERSNIDFDQLLFEQTWVHISFAPAMRRQVLTKQGSGFVAGLPPTKEKTT